MVLDIVIIEQAEVLCERGFQSRVTLPDVQRVTIIRDVQQVTH